MIRRSQLLASVVALVLLSVAISAEDAIPVPKVLEEYSTSKRINRPCNIAAPPVGHSLNRDQFGRIPTA